MSSETMNRENMSKITIIFSIILSIAPTVIQSATELSKLSEQNNRLSLNLLNVLPQNQNNFYSPLSIQYSLYMLLNGANGRTDTEIKTLFGIKQNETINTLNNDIKSTLNSMGDKNNLIDFVIRFANRILISKNFNLSTNYESIIREKFLSAIDSVDFRSNSANITDDINEWIRQQTNGKIDKLFNNLNNDTLFVISNALYLSAVWEYPFDNYSTIDTDFYGYLRTTKVPTMRQMRKYRYTDSRTLNASVLELPFIEESNISMIIILPNDGLNKTIESLTLDSLNNEINRLYNKSKSQVNLTFPKFELETEYNLQNPLKQLGLSTVFESNADLSGITGSRNVHVSQAIHKAVFKVTETGAEASAAVGLVGVPHIWIPPVEVKVDKPFIFIIRDINTGLILFLGQVLDIMLLLSIILLILLSILTINCQVRHQNDDNLISINNKLALNLLNTMPKDGNNFFSPLSITTALMMVLNGANGITEQELKHICNIGDNANIATINDEIKIILKSIVETDNKDLVLKLANLLLVTNQLSLNKDYKQLMTNTFDSTVESVDFANDGQKVIDNINKWVEIHTNNKITDLIKIPLDPLTAMILINAVYFKGTWRYLFDKSSTKKGQFHDWGNDETVSVDMMSMKRRFKVKNSKQLDANVFEMPFIGDMSMIILLPNDRKGLDSMTKKLNLKTFNDTIYTVINRKGQSNSLYFPKFKLKTEYNLKDLLRQLGGNTMFTDLADFSRINGQQKLKISEAVHNAYIEVNEEGAEAAAVSRFHFLTRTFRSDQVRVDRPFMFAIVDIKSGLIWFLGQIRTLLEN
ncbi:uncharacterized protein LOC128964328 [Oppia nitens]|uniref:uncharacterized protein LOC128964328 n=1 Tax=Oppia nitens TaxID=1686743 RepID=UPI0023DCA254|nr:uncharacterized protein LOC128964328 [Oppia nitens]